jgi:hypothetical protein
VLGARMTKWIAARKSEMPVEKSTTPTPVNNSPVIAPTDKVSATKSTQIPAQSKPIP